MASSCLLWMIALLCIPALISADEETIEIRSTSFDSTATNPFFLTSPGYPRFMNNDFHKQVSCKREFRPKNRSFMDVYNSTFHVQMENFTTTNTTDYWENHYTHGCSHSLNMVNLLGDEIAVHYSCSKIEEDFSRNSLNLTSLRTPKNDGTVHVLYKKNTDDAKGRFKVKVEVHTANGDRLPGSEIRVSCDPFPQKPSYPSTGFGHPFKYEIFSNVNSLYNYANKIMILSPGWPEWYDGDKLMCELTFQPIEALSDERIYVRTYIEQVFMDPRSPPAYKLTLVNMLGDILEVEETYGISKHRKNKYTQHIFPAAGEPNTNGSMLILLKKLKDGGRGKFCLIIDAQYNGPRGLTFANGKLHVSCHEYSQCSLPEIDNGHLNCAPLGNNFNPTCVIMCNRGYVLDTSISYSDDTFNCTVNGWAPDISAAIRFHACKPMCTPPSIENGHFACTPLGNDSFQRTCVIECDQYYSIDTLISRETFTCHTDVWTPNIPAAIQLVCRPQCRLPVINNGIVNCTPFGNYPSVSWTCVIECNEEFRIDITRFFGGSFVCVRDYDIIMNHYKQWFPIAILSDACEPTCVLPEINNGRFNCMPAGNDDSHQACVITCNEGYNIITSLTQA